MLNNNGPKVKPCGTPQIIPDHELAVFGIHPDSLIRIIEVTVHKF